LLHPLFSSQLLHVLPEERHHGRIVTKLQLSPFCTPSSDFSHHIDLEQCLAPYVQVIQYGIRLAVWVGFEFAMNDKRTVQRKKLREELAGLKNAALAELERRGYDVRGKTPVQIRQILRRRPSKQKSEG
jgi:hypothetical protein